MRHVGSKPGLASRVPKSTLNARNVISPLAVSAATSSPLAPRPALFISKPMLSWTFPNGTFSSSAAGTAGLVNSCEDVYVLQSYSTRRLTANSRSLKNSRTSSKAISWVLVEDVVLRELGITGANGGADSRIVNWLPPAELLMWRPITVHVHHQYAVTNVNLEPQRLGGLPKADFHVVHLKPTIEVASHRDLNVAGPITGLLPLAGFMKRLASFGWRYGRRKIVRVVLRWTFEGHNAGMDSQRQGRQQVEKRQHDSERDGLVSVLVEQQLATVC
jgi:hypothetical protein